MEETAQEISYQPYLYLSYVLVHRCAMRRAYIAILQYQEIAIWAGPMVTRSRSFHIAPRIALFPQAINFKPAKVRLRILRT